MITVQVTADRPRQTKQDKKLNLFEIEGGEAQIQNQQFKATGILGRKTKANTTQRKSIFLFDPLSR